MKRVETILLILLSLAIFSCNTSPSGKPKRSNLPHIDYIGFHWYDYGLSGQLDRMSKYGKKIWVTEIANWHSGWDTNYAFEIGQMQDMTAICENNDNVFRYAWFIGRGADNLYSGLMTSSPGQLTPIGIAYTNAHRSGKRGVCFNTPSVQDLATLSNSVNWWYSWGKTPGTNIPGMEFIPMIWGLPSAGDITTVENYLLSNTNINYFLVLNEPNFADQANVQPGAAASNWDKYVQVVTDLSNKGRTVYLVGPQMNYSSSMPGYNDPVAWMDEFYKVYTLIHPYTNAD